METKLHNWNPRGCNKKTDFKKPQRGGLWPGLPQPAVSVKKHRLKFQPGSLRHLSLLSSKRPNHTHAQECTHTYTRRHTELGSP